MQKELIFRQLMFGQQGSLAPIFPKMENKKDLQENDQDYLQKLSGSSKKYLNIKNLPTCSLKMLITHYQSIKDGTLPVFSLCWMRTGTMRNGMLSPQQRLESLKDEKESLLSDILEEDVSSEYLVDTEKNSCILEVTKDYVKVRQATQQGYDIGVVGDAINIAIPTSKTRRGRVGRGVAQTLLRSREQVTLRNGKLYWLTERESWRLQGIPDEYFNRAKEVTSSNQLYAQAGNGLTVNIARFIGERMGYEED